MFLRSLSLKNWRAIQELTLEFNEGVTIIHGPNESGKSSIRDALRAAFVTPSRQKGKSAISDTRPWGQSHIRPEVEVYFRHGGVDWHLKRVFFGEGSELWRDDVLLAREERVIAELEEHLEIKGIQTLWSTQGSLQTADVSPELRSRLATSEAVAPGSAWLELELDRQFEEYWTDKLGQPKRQLQELRKSVHQAEARERMLELELKELDEHAGQIEALEAQVVILMAEEQTLTALEQEQKEALRESQRVATQKLNELERKIEERRRWLDRWENRRHAYLATAAEADTFQALKANFEDEMGSEPARSTLDESHARLRYGQARLSHLLHEQIRVLPVPSAEQLESLRGREAELTALRQAVQCLADIQQRQDELQPLAAQVESLDQQLVLAAQRLQEQLAVSDRQRGDRQAELSTGEAEWKRLDGALSRWSRLSAEAVDRWPKLVAVRERFAQLQQAIDAPVDDTLILALKQRIRYTQGLLARRVAERLLEIHPPDEEDLKRLGGLEQSIAVVDQALKLATDVEAVRLGLVQTEEALRGPMQREETLKQLLEEQALKLSAEQQTCLAQHAELTGKLQRLEMSHRQWTEQKEKLMRSSRRVAEHRGKLDEYRGRHGEAPDRSAFEALQVRLQSAREALQQRLVSELESLRPPDPDLLKKLEGMEHRQEILQEEVSRELPLATPPAVAEPKWDRLAIIVVSGVITGLAVGFGARLGGPATIALTILLAVLAGAVAFKCGLHRPGPTEAELQLQKALQVAVDARAAREQEVSTLISDRQTLLAQLGISDVHDGKVRLERAAELKARLAREPGVTPAPVPSELSLEALESEVQSLARDVASAENELRDAEGTRGRHREEYEHLLQQDPTPAFDADWSRFAELSVELGLATPETPDAEWMSQLEDGVWDDPAGRLTLTVQAELADLPQTPHLAITPEKVEFQEIVRNVEFLRSQQLQLLGALQGSTKMLDDMLLSHRDLFGEFSKDPGGVSDGIRQLQGRLHDDCQELLTRCRLASHLDGAQRLEAARELRALPLTEVSDGEMQSLRAQHEQLDELNWQALAQHLRELPSQLDLAEKDHRTARKAHDQLRSERDKLGAQNVEQRFLVDWDGLLALAEELGLELPEQADDAIVRRLGHDLAHPAKQKRDELGAALTALREQLNAAEDPVVRELQAAQAALQARLDDARTEHGKQLGLLDSAQRAYASLAGASPDAATRLQSLRLAFEGELQSLEVESVAQAEENLQLRARLLARAESLVEVSGEETQALRSACVDAERIDRLDDARLQDEMKTLAETVRTMDEQWQQSTQRYSERRETYRRLCAGDPRPSLAALRDELSRIAREWPDGKLEVPLDPDEPWTPPDNLGASLEPLEAQRTHLNDLAAQEDPRKLALAEVSGRKAQVQEELRVRNDSLQQNLGSLRSGAHKYGEVVRAREATRLHSQALKEMELEANSIRMLRDSYNSASKELEDDLVGPLRERVGQKMRRLTLGRYQNLEMTPDSQISKLITPAKLSAPLDKVSFGTKEQIAFLSRLCLGELLSTEERHLVVFDDSLVHSDSSRIEVACELLRESSERVQIILFTCHPELFQSLCGTDNEQALTALA
jgi:DNA repair exonuclease SbcCD ATPase subunit